MLAKLALIDGIHLAFREIVDEPTEYHFLGCISLLLNECKKKLVNMENMNGALVQNGNSASWP